MEILTAKKKVDLDVLVMANWNDLLCDSNQGKHHVWLIRVARNYFELKSTVYNCKPQNPSDCWYLGLMSPKMSRADFSSQFPAYIDDLFFELLIKENGLGADKSTPKRIFNCPILNYDPETYVSSGYIKEFPLL